MQVRPTADNDRKQRMLRAIGPGYNVAGPTQDPVNRPWNHLVQAALWSKVSAMVERISEEQRHSRRKHPGVTRKLEIEVTADDHRQIRATLVKCLEQLE